MTTGRTLAAKPRSASQTSPGLGFIEEVQDFLFGAARSDEVEDALIGEFDDLGELTTDLIHRLRAPFSEPPIQLFG